jgi:hypothetical protein
LLIFHANQIVIIEDYSKQATPTKNDLSNKPGIKNSFPHQKKLSIDIPLPRLSSGDESGSSRDPNVFTLEEDAKKEESIQVSPQVEEEEEVESPLEPEIPQLNKFASTLLSRSLPVHVPAPLFALKTSTENTKNNDNKNINNNDNKNDNNDNNNNNNDNNNNNNSAEVSKQQTTVENNPIFQISGESRDELVLPSSKTHHTATPVDTTPATPTTASTTTSTNNNNTLATVPEVPLPPSGSLPLVIIASDHVPSFSTSVQTRTTRSFLLPAEEEGKSTQSQSESNSMLGIPPVNPGLLSGSPRGSSGNPRVRMRMQLEKEQNLSASLGPPSSEEELSKSFTKPSSISQRRKMLV